MTDIRRTHGVHQLVHTLSYGDAISAEVLSLARSFRERGFPSEVFAINVHPRLKGEARSYLEFPKDFAGEVVLHYSLGSPLNELYRSLKNAKRALIYHNLTPAHWFDRVNPRIVDDIQRGMDELPGLCAVTDRLLADSAFNGGELAALGFKATTLELMIDPKRWSIPANPGIASLLQGSGGIHVLHVGRLAPNKCIEDIIRSFCFLHHHISKHSTLWLPGIDIDTELYSYSLKRLVRELALEDAVRFTGCMDDSELRSLYEGCSVYLCMSEHEGFCLPLLEAMHFGAPVIAYASSAIPDTVGKGGILVREKRHPEIAELIAKIHSDLPFRESLIAAGRARVAEHSMERFQERVSVVFELGER
jgi:glycosyltransferase involved in cell wall biosynthesis